MEDKLIQIGLDVLAILIPFLVALAIGYLRQKLGVEGLKKVQEELSAKQDLALIAVRFVEQAFKELHGQDKYDQAAEWLSAQAEARGLHVTADEIKGLIEAALRMLKDEFTEQWASAAS